MDQNKFLNTIKNRTNVRVSILTRAFKLYSTQLLKAENIVDRYYQCNTANLTQTGFWYDTDVVYYYAIRLV